MIMLPNTMKPDECATLLDLTAVRVRKLIDEHQLPGFRGGSYRVPRTAFYKVMGWDSDEEVRHAYAVAGLDVDAMSEKFIAEMKKPL